MQPVPAYCTGQRWGDDRHRIRPTEAGYGGGVTHFAQPGSSAPQHTDSTLDAPADDAGAFDPPVQPRPHARRWARIGIVGVLAAALLGLGAGVASAHVTVNPPNATAGSYAKLTFRVPTESDVASTVSVQVSLPTAHPFASVSLQPIPGWSATTKTVTFDPPLQTGTFNLTDAVSSVTWTADDGVGVKPGEFQEFSLSVGPVPDVASLTFPAIQTYSDGAVVTWDEVAAAGQDPHSLDHPAPLLTIAAQTGTASSAAAPSDTTAQVLAAAALVIAAIALVVAALGWRRVPRAARKPAPAARDLARATQDAEENA
jgi:periplasmic copper chaperone A